MTTNKVSDESKDKAYFTITPQLVWALSKDPYDFTLWNVIKMIAGDSGECYLSTEDLATLAMMSAGKVSQCRKRLIKHGLLEGEIRRDPGYPQPVWHLSIPDLWERNLEWRQDIGDDLKKRIEFKDTQKKSLHVVKASPGEEGITPDEEGIPSGEEGITPDETKEIQKEIQSDNQKGNPSVSAFPKTPAPSPAPDGGDPIDEQAVVDSIAADFLNNTAPEDLQRVTKQVQAEAGNWADVGEDALATEAITCLCKGKLPKRGSGTWRDMINILKPIHADWGLHDMEVDEALAVVRAAIALFLDEKQQMAVYKYPSFAANYGQYLSRAMNGDTQESSCRDDPDKYDEATRMTLERLNHGHR